MDFKIKTMTFNLRFDCEGDGINRFSNRLDRVLDVIKTESPQIIGFQEVTEQMKYTLISNLRDYSIIGCGRDKNYHGEAMVIAYKYKEIELISLDNVWLSDTPRVPGSRYESIDQSGCPRMYAKAYFKHEKIDKPFYFINTHLDHWGEMARLYGANQLANALAELDGKFVLTGDFNATPDSKEIKLLTNELSKIGGIDCTKDIAPTFHAFGALPKDKWVKIDYIFTNGNCKEAYSIKDIPVNGKYYSDHNAICAYIEF